MPDVSTVLGAPPNRWKTSESVQMKRILECYKAALVDPMDDNDDDEPVDFASLSQTESFAGLFSLETSARQSYRLEIEKARMASANQATSTEQDGTKQQTLTEMDLEDDITPVSAAQPQRDVEYFLPVDSVLRSKKGEGREPKNVPFKDFRSFIATTDFSYWKDNFRGPTSDRFLAAIAESMVSHICSAQASDLRVRHGSVPLGKILRKKREHITPLALTLHELKLWATTWLRTASVFEQSTYKAIERRIRYLELLQRKEVWGPATLPLQSGMRAVSHDKLFRLMLTSKEDLYRARDYSFRGYCRRASREKLARLGNLLKDILLNEMKVISGLFSMTEKLNHPKTRALQPTDLLGSWQNQTFVNYENIANVLLSALCHIPLVKASLLSNYESEDVRSSLLDIANWRSHNLFVVPGKEDESSPMFLFDDEKDSRGLLPEVYQTMAVRVKEELAKADPHQKPPLSRKAHVKILKKAFKDEIIITEVMKALLVYLATLQDLVPSIYISFELWSLAGQGGDFVLYDMLREQCIGVMKNTISRVHAVQTAGKRLIALYHKIVRSHEKAMERKRLLSKKASFQPAWVANFYTLKLDLLTSSQKAFSQAYLQLWEVARDAWEYNLTADQLNDKVETLRLLCDEFAPSAKLPYNGRFQASSLVDLSENDWLHLNVRSSFSMISDDSTTVRSVSSRSSSRKSSKRSTSKKMDATYVPSNVSAILSSAHIFSDDEGDGPEEEDDVLESQQTVMAQ